MKNIEEEWLDNAVEILITHNHRLKRKLAESPDKALSLEDIVVNIDVFKRLMQDADALEADDAADIYALKQGDDYVCAYSAFLEGVKFEKQKKETASTSANVYRITPDLDTELYEFYKTCELSGRAVHGLNYAHIMTLRDLLKVTQRYVLKLRNIGVRTVMEIEEFLTKYGFQWEY